MWEVQPRLGKRNLTAAVGSGPAVSSAAVPLCEIQSLASLRWPLQGHSRACRQWKMAKHLARSFNRLRLGLGWGGCWNLEKDLLQLFYQGYLTVIQGFDFPFSGMRRIFRNIKTQKYPLRHSDFPPTSTLSRSLTPLPPSKPGRATVHSTPNTLSANVLSLRAGRSTDVTPGLKPDLPVWVNSDMRGR